MQHGFQRASLAPSGFAVDAVQVWRTGCKSCFDHADRGESALVAGAVAGVCKAAIGAGQQICRSVDDV
jgi:hypothetical protein